MKEIFEELKEKMQSFIESLNSGEKDNNNPEKQGFNRYRFVLALTIGVLLLLSSGNFTDTMTTEKITYSEFIEEVKQDKVKKVDIKGEEIVGELKNTKGNKKPFIKTKNIQNDEFINLLLDKKVIVEKIDAQNKLTVIMFSLIRLIPTLLMTGLVISLISNTAGKKKKHKNIEGHLMEKTFKDVAGQDEAIEQLTEVVDFMKNPERYSKMGAKLPKGALLVGPPGTGKTLMAKALAAEANVPFYSISGSDFIEMFAGLGASRVRELFEEAKKNQPSIIFIDEIDAIGKSRNVDARSGGDSEREQTLNQLLTEMDGFDVKDHSIMVLAATNMPESLDQALLRPGRFDRRIIVNNPSLDGRVDILKVATKSVPLDEDVDLKQLALMTSGASGAELTNIVNEAVIIAVRDNKEKVTQKNLTDSIEVVFTGKELKNRIMSQKERELVAYHEVGHAIVATALKGTLPIQKITIIPRTSGALGFTMQTPQEERVLETKDELINEIITFLGGRAAEEYFFGVKSTGASDDIKRATDMLHKMITVYGMSDMLGMVSMSEQVGEYVNHSMQNNYSQKTLYEIETEVVETMAKLYDQALDIMKENENEIHNAAKILLDKENISQEEFKEAIGNKYL